MGGYVKLVEKTIIEMKKTNRKRFDKHYYPSVNIGKKDRGQKKLKGLISTKIATYNAVYSHTNYVCIFFFFSFLLSKVVMLKCIKNLDKVVDV